MEKKSIFKGTAGHRLLRGLFYETILGDKDSVVYTLKDSDHKGYPSLYRLYMELEDQTEFVFANTYLDGWEHWEMLTECNWFRPYAARWRKELELKLKARYLAQVKQASEGDSPQAVQNAKYLLEKGWDKKDQTSSGKRGRPSKDEILMEATRLAQTKSRIDEDFERLFVTNTDNKELN